MKFYTGMHSSQMTSFLFPFSSSMIKFVVLREISNMTWIAMKFDIHVALWMNCNQFDDTFTL